jgi:hypothetical protein
MTSTQPPPDGTPRPDFHRIVMIGLIGMGALLAIAILAVAAGRYAFDRPRPPPAQVAPPAAAPR